jgi:hypothetical protein
MCQIRSHRSISCDTNNLGTLVCSCIVPRRIVTQSLCIERKKSSAVSQQKKDDRCKLASEPPF